MLSVCGVALPNRVQSTDLYNTGTRIPGSKKLEYQDGGFICQTRTPLISPLNWMTKSCQLEHCILECQYGVDGFKILLAEYIASVFQYYTDQWSTPPGHWL